MSVNLDKPTDAPAGETIEPLYLTITQRPDGRIDSVTVTDTAPFPEDLYSSIRSTVWTTPVPEYEDSPANAAKVLDLALSGTYRHEDGRQWANGERAAANFHTPHNPERATLRAVEAHIIRAGHLDVTTGPVQCQGYGLTIITGNHHGGQHDVYRHTDGTWQIAMQDITSCEGWYVFPGTLAPANASPRAVAAAILAHVYNGTETRELRPLARLRVAYVRWRRTPHFQNLKYRAMQRLDRYRRRVTVRIPRG
ncbi:hypothetical protein ACPCSC_30185 [Streptomyces lavendulocolor]|uniref:hypothetical protein n=1 Tax=Streptomyces lavendulocolor TaxID=67316 RepID=UPI003C2DC1DC